MTTLRCLPVALRRGPGGVLAYGECPTSPPHTAGIPACGCLPFAHQQHPFPAVAEPAPFSQTNNRLHSSTSVQHVFINSLKGPQLARSTFPHQLEMITSEQTRLELSRSLKPSRSEEHTSELQSLRHLVCRLLL